MQKVFFKDNRGLFKYIVFTILTLGIYALYYIHAVHKELNFTCHEDGKKTRGLLGYILLSAITCGIYMFIWWYKAAHRMEMFKLRYSLSTNFTAGNFLLWMLFGPILFGVGGLVATYKFIHMHNAINHFNNEAMRSVD